MIKKYGSEKPAKPGEEKMADKENKKKPLLTPKEKKAMKRAKKEARKA